MSLHILEHGIVHLADDGQASIYRPGKHGRIASCIMVPERLAVEHHLAEGDVVEGEISLDDIIDDCEAYPETEKDGKSSHKNESSPLLEHSSSSVLYRPYLKVQMSEIARINGLSAEEAEERPYARKRKTWERIEPASIWKLAINSNDITGRLLDMSAPFAPGTAGIIYGPHAAGLTRTLRSVVTGVTQNHPEAVVIVLLFQARGEEITDWQRRFPQADVIVCSSPQQGGTPEDTLLMADLALACAMRQTELERDALLAVDSLTGLWGAMLEFEGDDSQSGADSSPARARMRDWIQSAGCFGGEGPLGGSLGGSLSIVGSLWKTVVDSEQEEEGELHPHLRLFEHILHDTTWRVSLSPILARERLFPAIDTMKADSILAPRLLSQDDQLLLAKIRSAIAQRPLVERHLALLEAVDAEDTLERVLERVQL